ncbi:MAG: hypothetical protein WD894_15940 [Pirellulales bacterium]
MTNRAAIGQILPCPKCASMVQVVPPLEGEAATTPVTTAAIVASMKQSAVEALPIPEAESIDQIAAHAVALVSGPPLERSPPPLPELSSIAPLEGVRWSAGIRGAPWIAIAGGLAAAAIVAAGTWWYLFNADPAQNVAETKLVDASTVEPLEAPNSDAVTEEPAADERPESEAGNPGTAIEEPRDDQTLDQSSTPGGPLPASSPVENATASEPVVIEAATSQQRDLPDQESEIEQLPANVDAATGGEPAVPLVSPPPTSDARVARKPSLVLEDLPATLLQATNPASVLSTGEAPANEPLDPEKRSHPPEQALPDVPPQAAEPALRRIAPAKVDVRARLGTTIAGVEFRDAPLHEAVETISHLAGVTISLNVDALAAAGVGIREPVSVTGTSLTVGALLEQALRPVGLKAIEEQGQLVISPISAEQPRKARYAVDDLVRSGDPPIEELAGMVRALIGRRVGMPVEKEPELTVTAGAINVSAAELEHDRLIELCEKLRVARGRPLRSRFSADRPDARFDPRRFELATRRAKAQAVLGRQITAGIGRPAPLCDVVAYLAQQSDITILIDGPALAAAGLAVETEARLVAASESLELVLERLLEPLGLVYRVLGDKVIEITTPKAVAARPCIEFYPVRGVFQGEASAADDFEGYRETLLADAGVESSAAVVVFDRPSKCLLVLAAYPEQVRLERALRKTDRP